MRLPESGGTRPVRHATQQGDEFNSTEEVIIIIIKSYPHNNKNVFLIMVVTEEG